MAENFQLRKESGWMIICTMPDVCKTPPNLPVPYPAVAFLKDSAQVPSNVKANLHPFVLHDHSYVSKTLGDQPGILKGVKSNTVGGKCFPVEHSGSFRVNNKFIVRADDQFWMNGQGGTGNTKGRVVQMPPLKEMFDTALDVVQVGLDVVGLIPGVGEIADGVNGLISLARGDYEGAALSFAAMVPFAGWAATGAKLGKKAVKVVDATKASAKAAEAAAKSTKAAKKGKKAGSKVEGKGKKGESDVGCPFPQKGKPVAPTQGAKVLLGDLDTDFELHSAFPVQWQRSYSSRSPVGTAAFPHTWYGQGWSAPFSIQIKVRPAHQQIQVILPFGRIVTFPYLEPEDQFYSISEDFTLIREAVEPDQDQQDFRFKIALGQVEAAATFYSFEHQLAQQPSRAEHLVLCTGMSDLYGNQTQLAYLHRDEVYQNYPSHLVDSIGRVLALEFVEFNGQIRLSAIQHLRGLDLPISADQYQVESALSLEERLFAAQQSADYQLEDLEDYLNAKVLVRYEYTQDADLAKVYVDDSPVEANTGAAYKLRLSRSFEWRQHVMTAHHQQGGVSSYYVYDDYSVKGRVIENKISTGEHFKFEYYDQHTTVIQQPNQPLEKTEHFYFNSKKKLTRYINASGAIEDYSYDHHQRLLQKTDADGGVTEYQYSGAELSKVRSLIDYDATTGLANWREISLTWAKGRLIEITDPLGQSEKTAYDFAGQPLLVTDALGQRTGIKYTPTGMAYQVTDAKGGHKRMRWDAYANLLKYQDCSGQLTHYRYDDYGRLTQVENALGQTTQFKYLACQSQPCEIIYPDLSVEHFKYDGLQRLVEYRDALQRSTLYQYSLDSLPISRKDAAHGVVHYQYDALRRFTGLINENGQTWHVEYDHNDQVIAETSFDGIRTEYDYSPAGQLIKHRQLSEQGQVRYSTVFERDLIGQLLEQYIVDHHDLSEKKRTRYRYDLAGQLLEARNADSHIKLEYDAIGQLSKEQLIAHWLNTQTQAHVKRSHSLTHLYDENGNRVETTLPDGRKLKTMYYGSGHAWHYALQDSQGTHEISSLERDALHQEIQRSQGQLSSQFKLDSMGRLTDQSVNWDDASNLKRLQRQYHYDKAGQLTEILDHRYDYQRSQHHALAMGGQEKIWQRKQSYQYDALSRLTGSELSSSGQNENYIQMREQFAFDPASNILPITKAGSEQAAITSNRIQSLEQDHQRVEYDYDDLGRVTQKRIHVKDGKAFGHLSSQHVLGQMSTRQIDLEWDEQSQLQASVSTKPDGRGGSEIIKTQYCYDPFGRRIAKQSQTYRKEIIVHHSKARTIDYTESAVAPRVQEAHTNQSSYGMVLGAAPKSMPISPTRPRITPSKRTQREQIRLIERQAVWNVWDGNRILQDHNGKHVFTTVYEADSFVPLARLVWLDNQLVQAANDSKPINREALEKLQQVAIQNVGELGDVSTLPPVANDEPPLHNQHQIYWYQNDHLGTPRELTSTAGNIAWEAVYQAWGNTVSVEWQEVAQQLHPIQLNTQEQAYLLQPHRFQGQVYDQETGLHYNRFRYYDPDAGRFISHDPIGLLGGDNHFQYAPNPVGWVDPFGLAKIYTKKGAFKGTGSDINYTVYQQDINWNQKFNKRGGGTETNLDRALRGDSPRIKTGSIWSSVNLHHSKQNAMGPLFEISGNTHMKNTALNALHPHRPGKHPYFPVDRDAFDLDRKQYWKERANEELSRRKSLGQCP